jgi:hypothetical protein
MRIFFINNDGGGFADHVDVADGISIGSLFAEKCPGQKAEDYLIRVNRQPAPIDLELRQGDRVSITPTKIDGAK